MASEFITRVERDKDEPYTVIFRTDDADKYKHIEDECRRMIGHEKPTVDAVPVVRCKDCKYFGEYCDEYKEESQTDGMCELDIKDSTTFDWFCADGERRSDEDQHIYD